MDEQQTVQTRADKRVCHRRSRRLYAAAMVAVLASCAGCSVPGATLESSPAASVMRIGANLRAPVWSPERHTVVAITDDQRLAEIAPAGAGDAQTRLSAPMAVGRNIEISAADGRHVLVPEPKRARVTVVDLASLAPTEDFDAGPAPAYLATDAGMRACGHAGIAGAVSRRVFGDARAAVWHAQAGDRTRH